MSASKRGILISFEGTEGSGKSTLMNRLAQQLELLGLTTRATREPGGTPVAEKIRSLLLHSSMDPWTELFLYEAARAEHLAQTIHPALEKGEIVLCDRFTDSTLAYQAHARGLPWKKVELLNQLATQGIQPDFVVFLDIDPETGLSRAKDPNRFEKEGVEFQKKVRSGFLKARLENSKKATKKKPQWITLKVERYTPDQLTQILIQRIKHQTEQVRGHD